MAGIVLESVSRVYPGGVVAVDRLSVEVEDHELLVLVGPSGCGKSTTLRMIAGLERVSSGHVRMGGRVVNDVRPRDRNIAMVFQNEALHPHWSVYENLAFGWRLRARVGWWQRLRRRVSRRQATGHQAANDGASADGTTLSDESLGNESVDGEFLNGRLLDGRIREAAEMLGIGHLLKRRPWQLSGGERQRVALGRALVREPDALLLDEPLANLDARWRVELRRELKRIHARRRTTTIYVTHDQVEALTLGDRIAVLNGGVLQQAGTPREIYDEPRNRFVAGFFGSPPMSFLEAVSERADGGPKLRCGEAQLPLPAEVFERITRYEGKKIDLGVRPEDVQLAPDTVNSDTVDSRGMTCGSLRGRVTLVEPLGDAAAVYCDVEGLATSGQHGFAIAAKVEPRTGLRPGDRVRATLDLGRAHWFDPVTGSRLTATAIEKR